MIFQSFIWILYVFRLIWTGYEISTSNFILFIDREFIYLFTCSWITIYLFRLNSWTFGGTLIRHWSINICFYRCPKFWMLISFFLKNASIVWRLLIIWYLISIQKKKKINLKNDKLTWERDIMWPFGLRVHVFCFTFSAHFFFFARICWLWETNFTVMNSVCTVHTLCIHCSHIKKY